MRTLYILSVIVVACIGCNHKREYSFNQDAVQGTWLVQAIDMDTDFYKPSALVLQFKGDSLYYKNLEDKLLVKQKLIFSKDSLSIDTIQYPLNKFRIVGGRLDFSRSIANRIQPSDILSATVVEGALVTKYWVNEKGGFLFDEDRSKVDFVPKDANEYYSYCYEIVSYDKKVFLQKKGNQLACKRDYQFMEQVLSISDSEMVTFGFVDGDFKKIVYKSASKPEIRKPSNFQLCNPYLNKHYPRDRYYYQGTEYNGGLYHVRKIFEEEYKVPQDSNESGIVQVRFVVNCEGKAGMFETQAFTNDYKLKEFSPEISDQIFEITKGLQDWIPGRNPKTDQVVDTYIYISYKIKNGKIIRIYP